MSPIARGALAWACARLAEPSTWAGFAAAIGGMTFLPDARQWSTIVSGAGIVVCGFVAMARKERGSQI